jgi:hypothetical protein
VSTPAPGDLLVMRLPGLPPEFVIADAGTRRMLSCGYPTLHAAIARAVQDASTSGVAVWQLTPGGHDVSENLVRVEDVLT